MVTERQQNYSISIGNIVLVSVMRTEIMLRFREFNEDGKRQAINVVAIGTKSIIVSQFSNVHYFYLWYIEAL